MINLADLLWRLGRDDAVGVKASPVSPKRVLARAHRKLSVRRAIVFVEVAAVAVVLTAGGFAARAVVQGEEGPPDTRSPSRPRGLVAEALDPNEVRLSWRLSRDEVGVAEYTVYRDGEEVDTVDGTTYTDTDVAPATTYEYAVDAVDEAGNRSKRSKPALVTTPRGEDTTPPSVPSDLEAEAVEPTQVDLSWSASEDDRAVREYTVYRDGEEVDTVEGTTYSDTEVEPETTYEYAVDAVDEAGNRSARSQPVSVTTPATPDTTPPTTPARLRDSGSNCAPELSWQPSTDDVGVAGYTIYRNGNEAATVDGATTTYTDPDLGDGDYTYTVEAFDEAGNRSPQSNTEAVECIIID